MNRIKPAIIVLLSLVLAVSVSAQSGPVLVNPSFEDGFSVRESPEVTVANGWDYSYLSGDDRWCRAPCFRPEFTPETEIVITGHSQRWFATFARQFGTIHQTVSVDAGQWYTFSCQLYAISEPDGQQAVFVGANPWNAGTFDRTMIWGEQQSWGSYREWNELSVTFQAFGDRVRVAVGSNNNYPTKNNAVYVDDCRLERASGPGPQPTPQPTQTPQPTPLPCPTCTPGGSCQVDYERIRRIVREELDRTTWWPVTR